MVRSRRFPAAVAACGATLALAGASLALAACGGGSSASGNEACPASGALVVHAMDSLKFSPNTLTAPAGKVTVQLINDGSLTHTFQIHGIDGKIDVNGSTKSGCHTFDLTKGTYSYYCGIAGHEQAGMKGTFTVTGA
jgi:plastocyanin